MIPVYFKGSDFEEPDDPIYHLVTADGLFLVRKTELFTVVRPAKGVPSLEQQTEGLDLRFPKIPAHLMACLYGFFQAAFDRWQSEAIALLYYSPNEQSFRLGIPPQTIRRYQFRGRWYTEGRVEYGFCPRPPGFIKLGDAHSHADLPAFHSCTDDRDDREDGLRIVFGSLHRSVPTLAASFVEGGRRYRFQMSEVAEDFAAPLAPPVEWMRQITCEHEKPLPRQEEAAQ